MNLMKSNSSVSKSNAFGYFNNGISLRTDRYRLTKFYRNEKPNLELYDHSTDPEENQNIAEQNEEIVKSLLPLLDEVTPNFYREFLKN